MLWGGLGGLFSKYDGSPRVLEGSKRCRAYFFFFFFTLVTGPRRSLSLKLSDTKIYERCRAYSCIDHPAQNELCVGQSLLRDCVRVVCARDPDPSSTRTPAGGLSK